MPSQTPPFWQENPHPWISEFPNKATNTFTEQACTPNMQRGAKPHLTQARTINDVSENDTMYPKMAKQQLEIDSESVPVVRKVQGGETPEEYDPFSDVGDYMWQAYGNGFAQQQRLQYTPAGNERVQHIPTCFDTFPQQHQYQPSSIPAPTLTPVIDLTIDPPVPDLTHDDPLIIDLTYDDPPITDLTLSPFPVLSRARQRQRTLATLASSNVEVTEIIDSTSEQERGMQYEFERGIEELENDPAKHAYIEGWLAGVGGRWEREKLVC
ncbi:hypothetical protein CC86DRAFT_410523 [Ophiobolus disseminans]|uniref:Uncharacterized protein n=1 Tax=Ophiobolus disseminans TaxID=1469910 RepID=A0A6A6ZNA2_9PLEO|nr:hypothetical protein CC86DRAFT_410523 [Ophiobolus disseminans]